MRSVLTLLAARSSRPLPWSPAHRRRAPPRGTSASSCATRTGTCRPAARRSVAAGCRCSSAGTPSRSGTSGPYSGFVLQINGVGHNPSGQHALLVVLAFERARRRGRTASSGAGSYTPKAGTVEGWSYVNGQSNAPKPPSLHLRRSCAAIVGPDAEHRTTAHARRHPHADADGPSAAPTHSAPVAGRRRGARRRRTVASRDADTGRPPPHPLPPRTAHAGTTSAPAHRDRTARTATPAARSAAGTSTTIGHAGTDRGTPIRQRPRRRIARVAKSADSSASAALPAIGALVVVAALGGAAWLRLRRRPE